MSRNSSLPAEFVGGATVKPHSCRRSPIPAAAPGMSVAFATRTVAPSVTIVVVVVGGSVVLVVVVVEDVVVGGSVVVVVDVVVVLVVVEGGSVVVTRGASDVATVVAADSPSLHPAARSSPAAASPRRSRAGRWSIASA